MDSSIAKYIESAKQAMQDAGMEQKDVASMLCVTPQHLNAVLNGRVNLSRKLEDAMCRLLHLQPVGWWMNPVASLNPVAGSASSIPREEPVNIARPATLREEELYIPVSLLGGLRAHMAFRQDWLACRTLNLRKLFLVRMEGDAMRPDIPDGALVLVDGGQCAPAHGRVFYVRVDGAACFRRLEVSQGRVLAVVTGANGSQPVSEAEPVEILGRALWQSGDL